MSDAADRAEDGIENAIADGIAAARRRLKSLQPVGVCHYCQSEVGAGRLFCDKDCADDWEHERRRHQELGK